MASPLDPSFAEGEPAPPHLIDVIRCQCRVLGKKCITEVCSCHKGNVSCTPYCNCSGAEDCCNPFTNSGVTHAQEEDSEMLEADVENFEENGKDDQNDSESDGDGHDDHEYFTNDEWE